MSDRLQYIFDKVEQIAIAASKYDVGKIDENEFLATVRAIFKFDQELAEKDEQIERMKASHEKLYAKYHTIINEPIGKKLAVKNEADMFEPREAEG